MKFITTISLTILLLVPAVFIKTSDTNNSTMTTTEQTRNRLEEQALQEKERMFQEEQNIFPYTIRLILLEQEGMRLDRMQLEEEMHLTKKKLFIDTISRLYDEEEKMFEEKERLLDEQMMQTERALLADVYLDIRERIQIMAMVQDATARSMIQEEMEREALKISFLTEMPSSKK